MFAETFYQEGFAILIQITMFEKVQNENSESRKLEKQGRKRAVLSQRQSNEKQFPYFLTRPPKLIPIKIKFSHFT